MTKGFFVTGSDTGVGKTEIAAAIASLHAAQGVAVYPRKPVESGSLSNIHGELLFPQDASTLRKASHSADSLEVICPYRFSQPLSPERAAELSGERLTLEMLIEACTVPEQNSSNDLLLVEGAGGFFSPIAEGALNADLAKALDLPIILVAEDRLGAVNQTLLSRNAILDYGLEIYCIILNNSDNSDMDNLRSLSERISDPVIQITAAEGESPWRSIAEELAAEPLFSTPA